MKLAEALQERSDLNKRIDQLKFRLSSNAIVQEGEKPAEDPNELLAELNGCISRLEELIARINLTNCSINVDGKSLTELIAAKDCLMIKLNAYRTLVHEASQTAHRASKTEIKICSAVNVKELQHSADEMAKEIRLIDNKMQETNWRIELQ